MSSTDTKSKAPIISEKLLAFIVPFLSFLYLLFFPQLPQLVALLPYLALIANGVYTTMAGGVFLCTIWIVYTLTLTWPLSFLLGRFFLLLVYLPINGVVFYKQPHQPASSLFLMLQTVFWDVPLLGWVYIMDGLGGRALCPFYSQVTTNLAIGSMPLARDVPFLVSNGVSFVVNLCREYGGPQEDYDFCKVQQLRLPTPDICEPSFDDLARGVILAKQAIKGGGKVFVHCKAGRGRSAALTFCLLVAEGLAPEEAKVLLKKQRAVVENEVFHFRSVNRFLAAWNEAGGDLHNFSKLVEVDVQ
eukprot:gene7211-7977_t